MDGTIRRFLAGVGGVAVIEFALIAPLFIMLLFGIMVYGTYFGVANSVAQLAADAARASIAGLSDAERTSIVLQQVAISAQDYVLIQPDKISVEAAPLATDSSQFRVAIKYDASGLSIWGANFLVPMPSQIIERTAVVKRGGY